MITIVIGVAFAVLLVPFTYAYAAAQALGVLARSAAGALYFIPAAFVAYVMRKPGAVILVGVTSGLIAMPFTPFGIIVPLVSIATGAFGELMTWLIARYEHVDTLRMILVGAATGALEFIVILAGLRSTSLSIGVIVLAVLISAAAFTISAVVAKLLADAVARTGVLNGTALGAQTQPEV